MVETNLVTSRRWGKAEISITMDFDYDFILKFKNRVRNSRYNSYLKTKYALESGIFEVYTRVRFLDHYEDGDDTHYVNAKTGANSFVSQFNIYPEILSDSDTLMFRLIFDDCSNSKLFCILTNIITYISMIENQE